MQKSWYTGMGLALMSLLLGGWALAAPLDGKVLRDFVRTQPAVGAAAGAGASFRLGMIPMSDAELAASPRVRVHLGARGGIPRPLSVLLTDYLPPVADQGHQGSCVGWSTAYYCFSYSVAHKLKLSGENRQQSRWQFSPAFIYHLGNNGEDKGMTIGAAFQLLAQKGCATLAEMPYSDQDITTQPDQPALQRAERYKAEQVGCLATNEELGTFNAEAAKVYLAAARNPIVIGIPVFRDFMNVPSTPGYVYTPDTTQTKKDFLGYHGVAIIGYDDVRHAFRMVNSWGTDWGDQGFLWLAEDYLVAGARDGWCMMPTGPAARGMILSYEKPAK